MKSLKVTVVVPTYQRPDLLLRCLQALLFQDFPKDEYEILIVSDGLDPSTNHLLEVMKVDKVPRFDSMHFLLRPAPRPPATLVGCLRWRTDCLYRRRLYPRPRMVKGCVVSFPGTGACGNCFFRQTLVPVKDEPTNYERKVSQVASAEFITANCAGTKKALERVKGFDERFKMAWREDSDLQFKFIQHAIPIVKVDNAVVVHPVRKVPWGISIKEERKGMFNALLYKKHPGLYREKIEPNPPWHYYLIDVFLLIALTGLLTDKPVSKITGFTGWILMTCWFTRKRGFTPLRTRSTMFPRWLSLLQ